MKTKRTLNARLFFRWYDLWVGAYYDQKLKSLYICPLPTVGIRFYWETVTLCPQCGNRLQKTAIRDEGWILQWDCINEDCPQFEDAVEYIDWPFGDRKMNGRELKEAGYEVF